MSLGNLQEILRKNCSIEVEEMISLLKQNLIQSWDTYLQGIPTVKTKLESSLNQALEEEKESLIQARMERLGQKIIDEIRSPEGSIKDIAIIEPEKKKGWF